MWPRHHGRFAEFLGRFARPQACSEGRHPPGALELGETFNKDRVCGDSTVTSNRRRSVPGHHIRYTMDGQQTAYFGAAYASSPSVAVIFTNVSRSRGPRVEAQR
jgi:hypothetical protein